MGQKVRARWEGNARVQSTVYGGIPDAGLMLTRYQFMSGTVPECKSLLPCMQHGVYKGQIATDWLRSR